MKGLLSHSQKVHQLMRLWACDLNAVRGEDSFVRAQWAGQPLLWHIYPQDEQAHMVKLRAWLTRVQAVATGMPQVWASACQAWNQGPGPDWPDLLAALPDIATATRGWSRHLAARQDLAGGMLACTAAGHFISSP